MAAASPHLARLGARGRPTGSAAIAEARACCTQELRALGFEVHEHSFEYSAFPGRWAAPVAGAAVSLAAIAVYLGRLVPVLPWVAGAIIGLGALGLRYAGGSGVLDLPFMRRRGVNLQAVRGAGGEPPVWLVAHLDSKWQPVPMLVRVAGVVVTAVGMIALVLIRLMSRTGGEPAAAVALMLTWFGAAALMLSIVGDRNDGTLDNASGVAAVLEALESIPAMARVGVLITDAEELALAGARAWARGRPPGVAINCDSVDDAGPLTAMYTGSRPTALVSRLASAATVHGETLRVLRLLPGILTDSVALADAGWETVTLSRGTARTLWRIHSAHDSLGFMSGSGIANTARVIAQTATEPG